MKAEAAPRARPRTLPVALAVGRVTLLEILRDKVLYNIIVCACLLLGVSFLATQLSVFRQSRVITNFGMTALSVSCAMIASGTVLKWQRYWRGHICDSSQPGKYGSYGHD